MRKTIISNDSRNDYDNNDSVACCIKCAFIVLLPLVTLLGKTPFQYKKSTALQHKRTRISRLFTPQCARK